jgi:hypothetical protein
VVAVDRTAAEADVQDGFHDISIISITQVR